MSKDGKHPEEAERDELLKRLLKTPPQPRPKREREKGGKSEGKKAPEK